MKEEKLMRLGTTEIILIVVLLVKPTGFMGASMNEKV